MSVCVSFCIGGQKWGRNSATSNLLSLKVLYVTLIEIVNEEPELGSYWDAEGTRVGQSVNSPRDSPQDK